MQSSEQTGHHRSEEMIQQQGLSYLTVKLIQLNKCTPTHQLTGRGPGRKMRLQDLLIQKAEIPSPHSSCWAAPAPASSWCALVRILTGQGSRWPLLSLETTSNAAQTLPKKGQLWSQETWLKSVKRSEQTC